MVGNVLPVNVNGKASVSAGLHFKRVVVDGHDGKLSTCCGARHYPFG
jgi:hypothetical protein